MAFSRVNGERAYGVLLRDSLDVYDAASFPIKQSRVLIRCMAFAYRASGDDLGVTLGNVQEMGSELERPLTAQVWTSRYSLSLRPLT